MTIYKPATPYSDSIKRPDCPRCQTRMMLARIRPIADKLGQDECTFECPKCENELTQQCQFNEASSGS